MVKQLYQRDQHIVKRINNFEEFLALKGAWDNLIDRNVKGEVFLTHGWTKCWWESYGCANELYIVVVEDSNSVVCINPLMLSRGRVLGFPVRKISFIENDESPHCGLLANSHVPLSKNILASFGYLLKRENRWDILWLRKIPEDHIGYLKSFFETRNCRIIVRESKRSPILRIESDWADFYKVTSQRFKKRARHGLNKLKKQGDIQVKRIDTPQEIANLMEDVFCIGGKSWKGKVGTSIGSTSENRRFFSALPRALSSDGNGILLWTLSLEGSMIAFEYHVRERDTVYALRSEFDEEYGQLGPGSVLDFQIVKRLFGDNIRLYNMCGDAYEYKLRWTSETISYFDLVVFSRRPYGQLLGFLQKKIKPVARHFLKMTRIGLPSST